MGLIGHGIVLAQRASKWEPFALGKMRLWEEVEGRQQPAKISLGLLPSGPDPVGEHNACANLPGRYMVVLPGKSKGS
jgi:hypothetical protein